MEDSGILGPAGATEVAVVVALRPDLAPGRHEANRARAGEIARELGAVPTQTYGTAIFGFAGTVPAGRLDGLRRDPRVETVELDQEWPLAAQTLPTGIDRIEADRNPHADIDGDGSVVNLDVAIIDTGIDGAHADLNVAGGYNATSTDPAAWGDGNGHGTHVAGTVGARDNGIGVVGVAPGVRVWAVKVCPTNTCPSSAMIAGIDWAAARKRDFKNGVSGGINFASANMSISTANDATACKSSSDGIHKAICGLVNEGVVFALAAGNSGTVKQAYPEVIAVSALADYDGKPGGLRAPTCSNYGPDDRLASFSNYGSTIDMAAPGACILSTYRGGGYATMSGTSMATPHVAGAVALYLHAKGLAPATSATGVGTITQAILAAGQPVGSACGYTNQRGYTEPLLFVNGAAFGGDGTCDGVSTDAFPTVSVTSPIAGATVSGTVAVTASAGDDHGVTQVQFFVDGASIGTDTNGGDGWSVSWNTTSTSNGGRNLTARATDTAGQHTTSAAVSVTVDNSGGGGGGETPLHVGGLSGSSSIKGKSGKWEASVTVAVHDGAHGPVSGATVSATWSGARTGSVSGMTDSSGTVTLLTGNLSSGTSVTLTVTNVTHATRTYDSSANHNPSGANPAITVNR